MRQRAEILDDGSACTVYPVWLPVLCYRMVHPGDDEVAEDDRALLRHGIHGRVLGDGFVFSHDHLGRVTFLLDDEFFMFPVVRLLDSDERRRKTHHSWYTLERRRVARCERHRDGYLRMDGADHLQHGGLHILLALDSVSR